MKPFLCVLSIVEQAGRPLILVDGPFGDYEKLVKEGHKKVNFYVNGEVRLIILTDSCSSNTRRIIMQGTQAAVLR